MKWHDSNFKYRKRLRFYSDSEGTDLHIKISLSNSDIKFNHLYGDGAFRFFDSFNTDLHYYVETFSSSLLEIWVKIPVVVVGYNNIYFYYGSRNFSSESDFNYTFFGEVEDLLAGWHFDEGSGTTAHDVTDNNYDLTLHGGITWVDGRYGKALNIGNSQYCSMAGSSMMSQIDSVGVTVVFSAYVTNSVDRHFFQYGVTGDPECEIFFRFNSSNQLHAFWEYGSGSNVSRYLSNILITNSWNTYVVTAEANYVGVFREGVLVTSDSSSYTFWEKNRDRNFFISGNSYDPPTGGWFNGKIDEYFIFRGRKSSSECQALSKYYCYVPSDTSKVWLININNKLPSIEYSIEEEYSSYFSTTGDFDLLKVI